MLTIHIINHAISHLKELSGKVISIIDSSVHADKGVDCWFVSDTGVVYTGVQHDDGIGQHIGSICREMITRIINA